MDGEVTAPLTVREALNAKLAAAQSEFNAAKAKVEALTQTIQEIPIELHAMTWSQVAAKIESWFK